MMIGIWVEIFDIEVLFVLLMKLFEGIDFVIGCDVFECYVFDFNFCSNQFWMIFFYEYNDFIWYMMLVILLIGIVGVWNFLVVVVGNLLKLVLLKLVNFNVVIIYCILCFDQNQIFLLGLVDIGIGVMVLFVGDVINEVLENCVFVMVIGFRVFVGYYIILDLLYWLLWIYIQWLYF